ELVEQCVVIAQLVGEPVRVGAAPLRQPIAPPIGSEHEPLALERVGGELPRRRNVLETVQEHDERRARFAPHAAVIVEAADFDENRLAGLHGVRKRRMCDASITDAPVNAIARAPGWQAQNWSRLPLNRGRCLRRKKWAMSSAAATLEARAASAALARASSNGVGPRAFQKAPGPCTIS